MKCKDCKVYYCQYRTTDAEKDCYYETQYTAKEQFDWQSFRAEAAKDILCSLLNRESTMSMNGKIVTDHRDFAEIAIIDADELIKQLKEKED